MFYGERLRELRDMNYDILRGIEELRFDLSRVETKLAKFARDYNWSSNMAQSDIDALKAAVTASTTVQQSALTLINGMAQAIRDAGNDPVELQSLVKQLDAQSSQLAAAITANTPQAQTNAPTSSSEKMAAGGGGGAGASYNHTVGAGGATGSGGGGQPGDSSFGRR